MSSTLAENLVFGDVEGERSEVHEEIVDSSRWHNQVFTVVNWNGDLWGISWNMGATELQEHEFPEDPAPVHKTTKTVEVYEYK